MFDNPSLITRIAIGKGIGFAVGLLGFIVVPIFLPDAGWLLRWGFLLWYTTLGAIIGMFGVFTRHPVLKLPMPWWKTCPTGPASTRIPRQPFPTAKSAGRRLVPQTPAWAVDHLKSCS